jgi:NitT/TauT family transport system permease protein
LFELLPEPGFWKALGATAVRALYGFVISFGSGVLVGAAAGFIGPFRRAVKPFLSVLRAVPVMSVILLGMLWFVTDLVPVFVTFLMVFPLVCANVLEGVLQIDKRLMEMGTVYRLDGPQKLRHIVLPSLIPFLFAAANAGIGMAWKVTIAAEVLCQPRHAVGTGIQYAQLNLEIPEVMAWTAAAVILSGFSEFLLGLAEKLIPWRRIS